MTIPICHTIVECLLAGPILGAACYLNLPDRLHKKLNRRFTASTSSSPTYKLNSFPRILNEIFLKFSKLYLLAKLFPPYQNKGHHTALSATLSYY